MNHFERLITVMPADMISITIITQAGQGSRERPSPSSSSERDTFERGRPPRPWKEKQSKKLQDCVFDANHSSGTSGTKSNSEQRMIEAPHIVPSPLHMVQEVHSKLYYIHTKYHLSLQLSPEKLLEVERRSSSTGANPGSDPRIVGSCRSSNGSSPHAANPGSDPLAGVGRCGSRNSVEAGEAFDEEALTEDDEEGEVVPRLHSPAAANSVSESPADVGSQNSNSSIPVGDPLSETPMANSMSEPPADASRRRSENSSVPVGDPLSDTTIMTLDGQGSDGGDGMMEAGETFDVDAQDDKEVVEGEVDGDLPVVGDPNHSAQLRRHISGSDATKQNRARGPSGNETRWKTFTNTPKSPSDEVEEELEEPLTF